MITEKPDGAAKKGHLGKRAKIWRDKWQWPVSIGRAEWWLIFGVASLVALIYFGINLDDWLKFSEKVTDNTPQVYYIYNYGNLLTRLLIISLGIFWVTFCFKQFNVEKHLATLNYHRAHTFDSMQLFLDTTTDKDLQDQIRTHLARSIFDAQRTGYLSDRGVVLPSTPSINLTQASKT